MTDQAEEIARLRAEVAGLRTIAALALGQAQAAHHLAMSLVLEHSRPSDIRNNFNAIADSADGPMLFSEATEEDLRLLSLARETTDNTLRKLLP